MIATIRDRLRNRGLGPFEAQAEGSNAYVLSGESVLCECALVEEAELIATTLTAAFEFGSPDDVEAEFEDELDDKEAEVEGLAEQVAELEEEKAQLAAEIVKLSTQVQELTKKAETLRKKSAKRK